MNKRVFSLRSIQRTGGAEKPVVNELKNGLARCLGETYLRISFRTCPHVTEGGYLKF